MSHAILRRTSAFIQDRLVVLLPLAMLAGFGYGLAFDAAPLKAAVLPLTFALVLPMMVGVELRKLFATGAAGVQLAALAINFLAIPFIAFWLGLLAFPGQPWLRLGLLLAALLPTSGMTVSWTGLSNGNVPEAVRMTVIGLVSGALLVPLYVSALLGAEVAMPPSMVATQIGIVVALPLALGAIIRASLERRLGAERFAKEAKPLLPGASTLGVLALVFVAIAMRSKAILAEPALLWTSFWPVALLYAANFGISTLVGRLFFAPGDAKALVFGTVLRNLSIALALLMAVAGPRGGEAALIVTWGFVIQVQAAAWYARFADRLLASGRTPRARTRAELEALSKAC